MSRYEFKVLPSPQRVRKLTGLARGQDKFCATLTDVMTDMGLQGWEFMGAETLPCSGRRLGLFPTSEEKSILVFRREIGRAPLLAEQPEPVIAEVKKVEPKKVAPKRVARSEVVARVGAGARRLNIAPVQSEAAISAV
ncbi:hypothetical protein HKCCE2091_11395 [Rhodobacterales bacterium HKCCE2091]|nr:hypothetical protein [Rhodobacterales bacterium HKCCE2091]